ncbi:MAG: hypothetical protein ABSA63_07065 [Thermoplasmata archaeon]
MTAVRLGNSRYMRCPLCHRFATFRLNRAKDGGPQSTPGEPTSPPTSDARAGSSATRPFPRFDDRRTSMRWIGVLLAPAVALALFAAFVPLSTKTALVVLLTSGVLTAVAVILMVGFLLPDRVR